MVLLIIQDCLMPNVSTVQGQTYVDVATNRYWSVASTVSQNNEIASIHSIRSNENEMQ